MLLELKKHDIKKDPLKLDANIGTIIGASNVYVPKEELLPKRYQKLVQIKSSNGEKIYQTIFVDKIGFVEEIHPFFDYAGLTTTNLYK